jgi:hypothetical protein
MKLKLLASVLLATTLLSACKTAPSDVRLVVTTCPNIVQYNRTTLAKVAQEVTSLPAEAAIPELLNDYGKMRNFCRRLKARAR